MKYLVLSRGLASSVRGGGVKALRLRSEFYWLDQAKAYADHLEETEKVVSFVAEVMEREEGATWTQS